jgi:hypothetical protein
VRGEIGGPRWKETSWENVVMRDELGEMRGRGEGCMWMSSPNVPERTNEWDADIKEKK